MNRHRSASARALLTFAALATALTAQGTPIGFAETYALAAERSKAVASLVQGTDEWYRYHCRERLDARDFATVRELLGAWERQHGRNRHVTETARRLALLDFAGDPAATYQYLRETLALRFEHRQQVGSEATGLGSALPASAIATATLRQRALQRDPNTVDRFTDAALPELLQTDLSDNQLHSLLTRLRRADLPNLPAAIVRNLGHRQSRGFGSLDVHGLLFLDQLEACAQLRPQLLDEPPFVGQMLRALTPNGDRRWQEDPALRHQQLLRLQAFADRLSPSFNSFKAHVLHHLLQHDLANGTVDEARFVAYLRLPRRAAYSNQLYVDSFDRTALANLGTEYVTGLPPVGDDQALVRDCLEHCFARRDDVGPFGSFLDADYVRHVLAETKLLLGQGAAERWYTLRNDAGAIERLEQRVEIRFPHTRKSTYAADEPVSIDVDCKNVPTLLVKVYAIDAHRYYTEVGREIGADIELDGVVPNHEQTVTSQLPRIRRQRHTFALPQLAGPGVYVIEFVGNGTSSRAVIHKGALHHTVRTTAAGHRFRIHDETGAHRRDATLWLGGRDYATDDQGEILVPFTTDAGSRTAVVRAGARASRVQFDHQSEGYTLDAVAHVERESLVAGQRAKVLLAPRLRCAGALASIRLLDEPVLELVATDRDGVTTRQEVRGLQLGDDQELVHEFVVPERLQRVAFWLRGRVRELDGDTLPMSCQAGTFDVNGVDGGSGRMSPALLRGERGYELELRGKNGELRAGKTLQITLQHRHHRDAVHATLASDGRGRILLGPLDGIESLYVQRDGEFGGSFQLLRGGATLPQALHALAGEALALPFPTTATAPSRSELSLTSAVADHFEHLRLADGELRIAPLPPGTYTLRLHRTGQQLPIHVLTGQRDGGWLVGAEQIRQAAATVALALRAPRIDDEQLVLRIAGHSQAARVHVTATRGTPTFRLPALAWPADALRGFESLDLPCQYEAGRALGDEYRYVLERRFAQKFPGNMLPRPSLLTNPWRLDDDSRNEAVGLGGRSGGRFGGRAGGRGGVSGNPAGPSTGGPAPDLGGYANLDYLPQAASVLANLRPDANGEVRIARRDLGQGNLVHVLVVDGDRSVHDSVVLPEVALTPRPRTLATALAADQAFAEGKTMQFVGTGGTTRLGDPRSVQVEAFESLADVHRAFAAIRPDAALQQFAFLLEWPTLPREKQLQLYGEHAGHELHFFLYHKDRAFFDAVVAPSLRSKRDKTFLDRWLLGEDLRSFTEPWDFAQLHLVEQILLTQRLGAAERQALARRIRESIELRPPTASQLDRLFDIAFASRGLAEPSGEKYRGPADKLTDLGAQVPQAGGGRGIGGPPAPGAPGPATGGPGGPARAKEPAAAAPAPAPAEQARVAEEQVQQQVQSLGFLVQNEQLGRDLQLRGQVRQLYRAVEPTRLVVERNYWQRRNAESLADVVAPNRFWADFAAAEPGRPFASAAVLEANGSFLETMFALAVLDLPFVAGKHEVTGDGEQRTLRAATPLLLVKKEVAPAERAAGEAPLLLGENFFRADDRHQFVDGEQRDKFVAGEFLTDVTYGCQVVVTNPSSQKRTANVLLQIPAGAIPVQKGFWTRGTTVELQPYATAQLEYFFYFPATGEFAHYPAHAAEKGRIAANATARTLRVVDVPTTVDTTSWEVVSQQGSLPDVLAFLDRSNLQRLDLDKIAWRMQDQGTFLAVLDLLRKRRIYHDTLWSYGIRHGDVPSTREYLEHQHAFLVQCGAHLRSPLVDIDPVVRRLYEHLELDPLVHQRAHLLGSKRVIGNADLAAQYGKLLDLLSYKPQLGSEDWLAVTYYMLLQDRVEEALQHFAKVRRDEVQEQVQYDYLAAYLSFFTAEPQQARGIAERYRDYPVAHWQKRFATVLAQLDEIDGKAVATDRPGNDALAATAPALELRVDGKSLRLDHKNLAGCELRFYPIDVEFAFSSRPFADTDRGGAAYVQPVLVQQATFAKDAVTTTLELPPRFHQQNVRIEVAAAGIRRAQSYFANALAVRFLDAYGQVVVTEPDTNQPLPKTYVKVFARLANGEVRFHKDGYTDLRGRFDYASLSDDPNAGATRYAVLVLHEQRGAVIRELDPPTR
jgi:hypothetical protein